MLSTPIVLIAGLVTLALAGAVCSLSLRRSRYQARLATTRYESIFNTAVDGIILIDEAGTICAFNQGAERMFGYTCDEVMGSNVSVLTPEQDTQLHNRQLRGHERSGGATVVGRGREILARHKDGRLFPVDIAVSETRLEKKRFFTGIVRDVSRYKATEQALRISQDRLTRSQTFANIGTWDWNIQTGELFWSDRIGPLFGYQHTVPETTYENFLAAVHPEDRDRVITAINDCVHKNKEYHIEHRVIWPNGETHWLLESGDIIRDEKGNPLRMLGVVQDISDHKKSEFALLTAKEQAERANRAKSDFLSSMSHELRTPMNAVLGFAQLLELDPATSPAQREAVNEIRTAGDHLLRLINDILDLTKIESGTITVNVESVQIKAILDECIQYVEPLAHARSIHIDYPVDSMASHWVDADATRLKQVFINLLSNAVKYNRDRGTVYVKIEAGDERSVRVSITDTGMGIAEEKLPALFEPFNRLGAECGEVEGSGIGLVIAKRLVERMNGAIGVNNRPGQGCQFWVTLPASDATDAGSTRKPSDAMPELAPMTLLYIEDNLANANLIRAFFDQRYPQVDLTISPSGGDGLLAASRSRPDILLLDLNLSDGSGYDVAEALRAHPDTSAIPIVIITANARAGQNIVGRHLGVSAYLTKPVDLADLANTLVRMRPRCPTAVADTDPTNSTLSRIAANPALSESLMERFNAAAHQHVARIEDAQANRSASDLVIESNRLGTAAATFEIHQLATACRELAAAARSQQWDDVRRRVQDIKSTMALRRASAAEK